MITIPAIFGNSAGLPVAFFAVTSITTIGLYIAYILPVFLRFRMGDKFEAGRLEPRQALPVDQPDRDRLGHAVRDHLQPADNARSGPVEQRLQLEQLQLRAARHDRRWSSAVWIAWEAGAKNTFKGPVRTVDDPDVGTPADPALMPA